MVTREERDGRGRSKVGAYTATIYNRSLVAQCKEPACQCRRCRFDPWVGKIDPLEKEMATHSSILARKSPRTEEASWLWSTGSQSQTQLRD
jgi:hypothetical protein